MLKNKKSYLLLLIGLLILASVGCSKIINITQSKLEGYPITSDVFMTLQRTVVPDEIPASSEKIFPL